ncbi:MAG: hypothetical protein JNL70_20870 [Saprospiraceae bacterium]|nr:hypothetical protein [Saprospiraceae bacterium]
MLNIIAILLFLLIFAAAAYFIFTLTKQYLDNRHQAQLIDLQQQRMQPTLPLRLQACERLILLCERISIPNLISRLRTEGASVNDLRMAMIIAIQQEFEHNITQQLYVSENLWNIIILARNNTADIVNMVAQKLSPQADSSVLINELFQFLNEQNSDSVSKAQAAIRQEVAGMM